VAGHAGVAAPALCAPRQLDKVLKSCVAVWLSMQAVTEMKEKFRPTLMANYVLWPAANLVNFAFVPPSQRILYCNVIYVSDCSALRHKDHIIEGVSCAALSRQWGAAGT
jgi:hypothetical protein